MQGSWGPSKMHLPSCLSFPSLTHMGRREKGLYPCQGDCKPDSVALWFARDEVHSHPVATVEQMRPAKGTESLPPPKCPVFSGFHRSPGAHLQKP